jgi:hypothetical protein
MRNLRSSFAGTVKTRHGIAAHGLDYRRLAVKAMTEV